MQKPLYTALALLGAAAVISNAATNIYEIGEITVEGARVSAYRTETVATATFFNAPPEELPTAVDVLTEDFIREQSPNDLHDLLFFQPGISGGGKTMMDRTSGQYSVRGQAGTTPSLDGTLPITAGMGMFLDPNALERVEIAKGPVGATQGGQTSTLGPYGSGGAINLILKQPKPDEKFTDIGLRSSFGSRLQRYRLTGDHNTPLSETLALRLPFSADAGRPFWLPSSGHDWRRSFLLSPSLLWTPSDDLRLGLSTMFQHTDTPGYQGIPSFRGKPLAPYIWRSYLPGDIDMRDRYNGYSVQGYAEWDVSDIWQLRAGAGYAGSRVTYTHIASSTYADQPGIPTVDLYDLYWGKSHSHVFNAYGRAIAEYDTGAIKQTTVIQTDGTHTRGTSSGNWTTMVPGTEPNVVKTPYPDTSLTRYGVFAQNYSEWEILRLLGGIRYDRHESNLKNTGDSWSPRLGLSVVPNTRMTLFGNISRTSAPNFGYMKSRTEELTSAWRADQYEYGIRLRPVETLWLTLSSYHIKKSDTPSFDTTTGFYLTEGRQRNNGYEASLAGNLADNWSFYLGYAYNHNKTEPGSHPVDGQPPHAATLQTMYRVASGALSDVALGMGYRYKHKYDGTMLGRYVSDDYFFNTIHVFDASVEVPFSKLGGSGDWSLQLALKNIFDKNYFESNRHYYQCFPGDPRTLEVAVRGRF